MTTTIHLMALERSLLADLIEGDGSPGAEADLAGRLREESDVTLSDDDLETVFDAIHGAIECDADDGLEPSELVSTLLDKLIAAQSA